MKTMGRDFAWALNVLKSGGKVQREGWNGERMYVEIQISVENSKMTRPYLYMSSVDNELVPWVASQSDLLASDWVKFEQPVNTSGCSAATIDRNFKV